MSVLVNIHEAKTNLSKLIRRMMNGEEVIIARAGKPVARLTPIQSEQHAKRICGSAKGKVHVSEDFDDSMPESFRRNFEP